MRLTEAPVLPPLPPQDYAQLRDSIRDRGVLQPLLITADHVLIDGHERWRAIQELGLTKYPLRVLGNLDEAVRVELAIRANLERRHLTVAQRRELAARLLREDPSRTDRSVAGTVGCDHKTVGKVRGRLLQGGEIPKVARSSSGRDGKTYHYPATSVESPNVARIAGRLLAELGDDAPEGGASLRTLNKMRFELDRKELLGRTAPTLPSDFKIHALDFRKLGGRVAPESVQLVVTDPPWLGEYEGLRQPFAEAVVRILKPGGFACVYSGHFHLKEFLDVLCGAGLTYRWLIACTNEDSMGAVRSGGSILTLWRPVLLFQKPGGRTKTPRILRDLIESGAREKANHPWQQPIEEAVQFVKTLSEPGDLVADLFVCSGTVPAAVATVGEGRRFVGTEIDGDLVKAARRRVHEVLKAGGGAVPLAMGST
ncbi:ParB/RepB/Spo0J family partition protein [Tautonia plasticadhaerens]|uniref:Methyltransferase n=1 Tax=Tautonia plasticadhaerens TaxID=2527974 RepID=A0A518H499_9BACT|nr:DNA methyltransferase [Tautonia plasticadhaerens]QDV35671.1 Chromosome-partitioning protein ParB [Tautonia plasticadhaerens]